MKFLYAALAVSIFTVISISSSNCLAEDESTEPTEQKEVLTASGTVIDSEGNPVPKATIACATWVNRKRKNILLKSDSDGKYKISYPNAKSIHQSLETWVWAKGHGVRTVMMKAKFLNGATVAKDVTIELPPNETFDIKITDPNGDSFANAKVEVTMGHVPNGQFAADEPTGTLSFVPTAISRQLLSVTDNGGTATIEGFPRQLMDGVSVSSGEYGTQILAVRERDEFQLVETGAIKGKINAPDISPYRGMKIYFETSAHISGKAIAYVNDDGTFSVPAIPPGSLVIDVAWPDKADIFPLDKYFGTVTAGETFRVESTFEPAALIEVSGRVVTADTGIPLPNADVSFGDRRGRIGTQAQTDDDGNFQAIVCEGKAMCQLIAMGTDRKISHNYNYPPQNPTEIIVVGANEKKFNIPDIKVIPRPTIRGRLVDSDGNPLQKTSVALSTGDVGHTHGWAKTDKDGNFEMQVSRPLQGLLSFGSHFAIMTEAEKETDLPTFEELEVINPAILDTDESSVDGLELKRFPQE